MPPIDIERKYRLLKVRYVPATSTTFLVFFIFFLQPLTVLMRQSRQLVRAINQSIFLRCLLCHLTKKVNNADELTYLSTNIGEATAIHILDV